MKLRHYSSDPIDRVEDREQTVERSEYWKPDGLWLSVEGNGDGWVDWCESECYSEPLKQPYIYDVKVDLDRVLWVRGLFDIDAFDHHYGENFDYRETGRNLTWRRIRWDRVAQEHDGIIIAPYVWERRLEPGFSWYYGWDCASGCIWRGRAVLSLDRVRTEAVA